MGGFINTYCLEKSLNELRGMIIENIQVFNRSDGCNNVGVIKIIYCNPKTNRRYEYEIGLRSGL